MTLPLTVSVLFSSVIVKIFFDALVVSLRFHLLVLTFGNFLHISVLTLNNPLCLH